MKKSYLSSEKNIISLLKPSRAMQLFLMVLFVCLFSNFAISQTASSTWALTANGNSANVGSVSGTAITFGSDLNSPAYAAGSGVTTGNWSNDASGLQTNEYYEFKVTPNVNNTFNVTAINFEHSRSSGNWQVRAYYSTNDFATSTPVGAAFSSNSSTPVASNNTVNLSIQNTSLTVRIYGWESDGSGRSLRIRNVVISGTTCMAGYWTGNTSNAWETASNWCDGIVPTSSTDVIIPSGATNMPIISSATGGAVAKSLIINAGATVTLTSNAASLLNITGDFTNNGTLTAGANSVVTFDGTTTSAIQGTSSSTFGNLVINKSANATTVTNSSKAFAVTSRLTITRGNLVLTATDSNYTVGNDLTVASTGTLTHNVNWDTAGKLLLVSGNLDISGAFSYSGVARSHVQMNGVNKTIRTGTAELSILTLSNTTGTISANGAVIINDNFWPSFNIAGGTFATAGNTITAKAAVLNSGGTLLINGGTLNVTGGLYDGFNGASGLDGIVTFSSGTLNADFVNIGDGTRIGTFSHSGGTANIGNLTINATGANAYTCSGTPTINISGSWTNNKTFTAANSTVNFVGTSAQTINGTLSGTTGKFYNLTFNGTGSWTNNAPMDVSNTLTMTNGILTTSASNLVNITNTAITGIAGGTSTSFVKGPIKWTLPTSLGSGSTYNFPVGKGSDYLPFSLVNPTTGTGIITAQVEAFNASCGGTENFTTIGSLSTTEYWSLIPTGNFTNSSVSLTRPTAISPFDAIAGSATVSGTYASLGGTAGTYGVSSSTAIGTNRFFTFGRIHGIHTGTISGSPFCVNSAVSVPYTIIGTYLSGNFFKAQLSDASGSFASPVDIGVVASKFAGTIPAVIPSGTTAGTGYRIRVVSTNPSVTGTNNGTDLVINPLPVLTVVDPAAVCSPSTVSITSAAVQTANTGTITKYYTSLALANAGGASDVTTPSAITASGTYYIRSEFATGCFIVKPVTVTINPLPVLTVVDPARVCSPSAVSITSAAVQTVNTGTITKYYTSLALANAGGASDVTTPSAITASGTYYIRSEFATGCFIVQPVTVTINPVPAITPNKVDETCPISNNGSITPVLSGGLTNVQYIKLTQKFVDPDAWQQVQEIQAFEIFTGTNVALQSNGATATASSTYSNTATFGPQRAIDGDYTGYSFWHSNSVNTNEYIKIDLPAAKNIDYLRIHNRVDCCWSRGQNMLLELYDSSNTLVYSKTVDLWGGVNGANYVDVNVLDIVWSDGAATLNRTALDSGTYTLNYADAVGCSLSTPVTISNINNTPTIASISAPAALCSGGSLNPSSPAVTANGSAISSQGWEISTTSGGSTYTVLTLPYTVAFADNGKNIRYKATNGCGTTTSNIVTLTINALPTTPTVVSTTQPNCMTSTGSVVLSGLPAGSWTINPGGITGSTSSVTISGLTPGTYNFTVSNGTCISDPTVNVVINPSVITTWNGTAWSPSAPTSTDVAVINADYSASSNGNLNICSVILNSGFTLTIEADQFVTIQNNLTVNGTLSVLDKGSLVMVNDAGTVNGTGLSIVRRFTTPYKKNDYVYWSTPVSTSAISSSSAGTFPGWRTGYAYEYNNAWVGAATMTPAKGYIVMVPDPTGAPGGNVSEAVFKGIVNNGIYNVNVAANKSYLIGNPYPSAIDADQFILQNSGVIGGALYFWTHATAIQLASNIPGTAGSGTYAYTSDDYAAYNIVGGIGAVTAGNTNTDPSKVVIPNGKIASGQGFFTTTAASISGTSFVFNNSMRISSGAGANSQFFKTKDSKNNKSSASAIEKHRIWLNLSNDKGAFKQTLLGYVSGATNGNDALFDGKTLDGNKYVDFYSVNQSKNLVIQGRALPFDDKDEVPLGYKTAIEGTFTINIDKIDGLLVNQAVFLQDKLTNTEFDLKSGSYSFTTAKGTFNDRFVLKYKSAKTLAAETFDAQAEQVVVTVKNKQIKINSSAEKIKKVLIYDVSGKQIYKKEAVDSDEIIITGFTTADQVLILKTTLQNGAVTTDKIVF